MKHKFLAVCLLSFAPLTGSLYAQTALLSQEIKNVDATADATVNVTLPPAPPNFRLSGAISGPSAFFVAVTAQTTDGLSSFSGSVNPTTNNYLVMLPAGTYKLSVTYVGSVSGATSISTFKDPATVQVNADTVHDIVIVPAVTHLVSGTISALDPRFSSTNLIFTPNDPSSGFITIPAKLNADGTYAVQLADGDYSAVLALSIKDFSRTTGFKLGSVTVAGADVSADFTAPAVANLSGTVQTADMSPVPTGSTVIGIDSNAFLLRTVTGYPLFSFGTGSIDSASGSYKLVLASGRTYTLAVDLRLFPEDLPQSSGEFTFLQTSNVQLTGDTTQDIAVPQTPGTATISGQVTDSTGAPIANATVDAGTAEVAGISMGAFSRSTQTDANGNYRLVVLRGTNYDLMFSAPIQSPSSPFQINSALPESTNWMGGIQSITPSRLFRVFQMMGRGQLFR